MPTLAAVSSVIRARLQLEFVRSKLLFSGVTPRSPAGPLGGLAALLTDGDYLLLSLLGFRVDVSFFLSPLPMDNVESELGSRSEGSRSEGSRSEDSRSEVSKSNN